MNKRVFSKSSSNPARLPYGRVERVACVRYLGGRRTLLGFPHPALVAGITWLRIL